VSRYSDQRAEAAVRERKRQAGDVAQQRRRAIFLLWFGIIRIIAWLIVAACVAAGLLHWEHFAWARVLGESLPFVVLISLYANIATDLDSATAAFAALVAADAHEAAAAVARYQVLDSETLQHDIARLADLTPGEEAAELSADIRRRLRPGMMPGH
jgi:hypothetical protein